MKLVEVQDQEQRAISEFRKVMLMLDKQLAPWEFDAWKPIEFEPGREEETVKAYGAFYKKRTEPFATAVLIKFPRIKLPRNNAKRIIYEAAALFDTSHFTRNEVEGFLKELRKLNSDFGFDNSYAKDHYALTSFVAKDPV